ncbi:MAG: hypothetical protein HQK83_15465 [Fibrobacteria bacterium]|nr:hypothetical protein [Fibrobacteria bacterium]
MSNSKAIVFIFFFLFISCKKEEQQHPSQKPGEGAPVAEILAAGKTPSITFETKIRPGKKDWELGKVYTDTLEFQGYDDCCDYPFCNVVVESGETIMVKCPDSFFNVKAEQRLILQWEIKQFSEAGEGEAKYYDASLISHSPLSFSTN